MKIFLDTSKIEEMFDAYENNALVQGFTTNPSLMRKAGVTDYVKFVKEVTAKINDKPLSFEIFADEEKEMEYQIQKLSEFGENIYVKVPVMNTKGQSMISLIRKMNERNIKLNITAVFTSQQLAELLTADVLQGADSIVSIFAGRIADTGLDPKELFVLAAGFKSFTYKLTGVEILWASVREIFNIYEAEHCVDIVTVPPDVLKKYIQSKAKNLDDFCRETVKMFYDDAKSSGLSL